MVRWRKVLLVAAVAVGLGSWIGTLVGSEGDAPKGLFALLDGPVLGFGLPLAALLLAAEGYAREVSGQTIVYHLVRPIRRATFFLARFLSGWIPATLAGFLLVASVVTASGVATPAPAWLALAAISSLSALALGAVFYTLGALFRHGLVAGLIYAFAVETMLASVPGTMQKLSVMFHVRSLFRGWTAGWLPRVEAEEEASFFFSRLLKVEDAPPGDAVLVLVLVAAAVLAFGAWKVTRRDGSP